MAKSGSLSRPTGRTIHDHLLSLVLLFFSLLSWVEGKTLASAVSADFLPSFLASLTFVVLATYLIHGGSPQSFDTENEMADDIKAIRKKFDA